MEVEIISKECIKPSSPTPLHLKNHKLSFLDLYVLPLHVPIVFYYPFNQTTTRKSELDDLSSWNVDSMVAKRLQQLKQSLSETLSLFYPFAGKIKDFQSTDCNDEGAYFVEARVKNSSPSLDGFLSSDIDLTSIKYFLPDCATWCVEPTVGNYLLGVQVTTFPCGGIVVGVLFSHLVADGTAFSSFLKSWTATTGRVHGHKNENDDHACPKFDGSSLFPYQSDAYPREVCMSPLLIPTPRPGKSVMKRILFDAEAIANLKAKLQSTGSSSLENPTRVESVTSLLCKCFASIAKARDSDDDKSFLWSHVVNVRRKATPPFSEYQMGNLVAMASASLDKSDDEEAELHNILVKFREGVRKLNGDYVNSLLCESGMVNFIEANAKEGETCGAAGYKIGFTSWCNFGLYEVDLGWGKPSWVSLFDYFDVPGSGSLDLVFLMDTKDKAGVEAWVCTLEDDMAKLVLDDDLLAFGTLDPRPL